MTFNRSKLSAVVLLLMVFVAGAVAGWGLQAWADSRGGSRRPRGLEGTLNYLGRELTLTPVQRDSVRAVFERRKPAMDSLWATVHPRFDSLRAQIRTEISAQLTPAQQTRYRELIEAMERRHKGGDSTRK